MPGQVVLDLRDPDLGHPDGRAIIEQHYRQGSRRRPEYSRTRPAFICMKHLAGTSPGLYIKKIKGDWYAAHYEKGCPETYRIPALKSDEHQWQAEYWARAAEDVGWSAELERLLHTGTRPDVTITGGPVITGIEVQRSPMTRAGAVARTRKALAAGVTDVWFTDHERWPRWSFRVPTVGQNKGMLWTGLPPRRAATATGLRVITAERCTPGGLFVRCPYGRGHCGGCHPWLEAWGGLTVDDVAARVPAGEIVPMRIFRGRSSDVFLVSPASRALYEELTGRSAAMVSYHPKAEEPRPRRHSAEDGECRNSQPTAPGQVNGACASCGAMPTGPGGILCPGCRDRIEHHNRPNVIDEGWAQDRPTSSPYSSCFPHASGG